jgi:hypothetical protein
MSETTILAEEKLLARQQLPALFGKDVVRPSYDGLGLGNIAALTMHWLAAEAPNIGQSPALPPFNPTLLSDPAIAATWTAWQQQAPINHVVLLLLDAFGYDQLCTVMQAGDAPGLAAACDSPQGFFMPATSVFPSTTVTGLTTAATAYAPAQHGVMCTSPYLREMGSVVNLIGWRPGMAPSSTPYPDDQLNPDRLLPVPNLYLRMEKAGLDVKIVNFCRFKGTSISRFTTVGSQAGQQGYIDYQTPIDGFVRLRDRLLTAYDQGKSFTYFYIPNLDTAAHRYGPLSSCYRAEVAALDFAFQREVLAPLAGRSDIVLLLTADHGQLQTHPDKILWLNHHPDLTQQLFVPATGESQARFLYVRPGQEAAVVAYVQEHLGDNFLALPKAEAIALGLFGLPEQPPTEEMSDRIGDLILIPRNGWSCFHRWGWAKPEECHTEIAGVHGGVSRAEMLIPFLAYRF